MFRVSFLSCILCTLFSISFKTEAQTLKLKDAINTALSNYPAIKAKANYVNASKASIQQAKRDYLPNLTLSAQQDYGTINGQNGPLYGFGGFGTASSGPALNNQNWNAAFGALYLSNVNWDFFTFGRIRERVNVAKATLKRDENDLSQEQFQHEVRVSAAFLNLLAAQRLKRSQQKNLDRATTFMNNAVVRAKNGLIAGVDSSLAGAEVSNAKIALTKAKDLEQELANKLGVLLGQQANSFVLDTGSINHLPHNIVTTDTTTAISNHPLLNFYRNRVELSKQQEKYYHKLAYPTLSFVGVFQGRGSGFESSYSLNQSAYSGSYGEGIKPTRANYLVGIGLTWNLTSILRTSSQVHAQEFTTRGLEDEYALVDQQLKAQLLLADAKIQNAISNYNEAPIQVKAASDAYLQKSTLYKNGLTTLVDLTQALYTLNRAETDRDIAYTNVWQALLIKSAALGDYSIFINEF